MMNAIYNMFMESNDEPDVSSKTVKLYYHEIEVEVKKYGDNACLTVRSLTDPDIEGYVNYDSYDDAMKAYEANFGDIGHVLNYLWRHGISDFTALEFDMILADELNCRNAMKDKPKDSSFVKLPLE
jgi:hypothetical protein